MTRKWNVVNGNSKANYNGPNEITCNTEVLKSSLCDYSDAYILVIADITIIGHQEPQVAFRNFAPYTKCIAKNDGTTIDDAEYLDLDMPMYSLLEYSSNYSETTVSLWFYSKDKVTNINADIANNINFKSFMYKAKLLEDTIADGNNWILRSVTIAVPLKYLSNFCRSLEIPLVNWKLELKLR